MDIDLELDYSDRISEFLRSKLQEIKSENVHLEAACQHRQQLAAKYREEISQTSSDCPVKLAKIWKKLFNGKYVLGVGVVNETRLTLSDFSVTLCWTSSSPLNYTFYLLHTLLKDGLKFASHLTNSGQIVIIFDAPLFTDHLLYTLSGFVRFEVNNKKVTVKLPSTIELKPKDVTDTSIRVDLEKVRNGSNSDILALALTGVKYQFIMVTSCNLKQIERIFTNDCNLTRIELKNNFLYFLSYNIFPEIDGLIVEIQKKSNGTIQLNVYSKSLEVTVSLLHYLYSHMTRVDLVPNSLYKPDLSTSDLTELLRKSLILEVEQLEQADKSHLGKLREKIAGLEHETNVLVAQIDRERNC